MVVFFFKQKTAYEMRISDWSSDVCFSDLVSGIVYQRRQLLHYLRIHRGPVDPVERLQPARGLRQDPALDVAAFQRQRIRDPHEGDHRIVRHEASGVARFELALKRLLQQEVRVVDQVAHLDVVRSEEHTSELQSLMRLSY